jgi:hypothetical protein
MLHLLPAGSRGGNLSKNSCPTPERGSRQLFRHCVNIFSPCGKPLVEIYDKEDIEAVYQSLELEAEFPSSPSAPTTDRTDVVRGG